MTVIEAAFNELPRSVLTGLYWLQAQRIRDARRPRPEHHLDELARRGICWLDELSSAVFERYAALIYGVQSALFFPDNAFFNIPLVDQMPALALPIDTGFALVFADRTADRKRLDDWMANEHMPMLCSVGLNSRRLVLPPELSTPPAQTLMDSIRCVQRIQWTRARASGGCSAQSAKLRSRRVWDFGRSKKRRLL